MGDSKEIELKIGYNKLSDHFGNKFTDESFFYYHPDRDPPEIWLPRVGIKERYRGKMLYQRLLERLMASDNDIRIIIPDPLPYAIQIACDTFGFGYDVMTSLDPHPTKKDKNGKPVLIAKDIRCCVWPKPKR